MTRIVNTVDRLNGYVFGGLKEGNEGIFETAVGEVRGVDVQERYLLRDDELGFEG